MMRLSCREAFLWSTQVEEPERSSDPFCDHHHGVLRCILRTDMSVLYYVREGRLWG